MYLIGKPLGSGGQATCYEVETNQEAGMNDSMLLENFDVKPKIYKYACKIIPKSRLFENERQKKKTEQELQLHKGLSHRHIVQFKHFFEDDDNIYIMLELCDQRSL